MNPSRSHLQESQIQAVPGTVPGLQTESAGVDHLLRHPSIWRAGREAARSVTTSGIATGFQALDETLAGGWPQGMLTELLYEDDGIGELSLLMPALAQLSRHGRWLAWVAPPYVPYAPALAARGVDLSRVLMIHPRAETDVLWSLEQALRSGTCGAVLGWVGKADDRALRRLQLAAAEGDSWGVLFRPASVAADPSPAALRLLLKPDQQGVSVNVLKRRGGNIGAGVQLALDLG
ncbi:MAG: translesion DNA synthesis-associated protein ImuA [Gammaproteobacteria bacterium]|nr:translesion DNA synthesis-associated protein ImuA [Gammaproteobacteria bacterium]MCP5137904.1 translesion DNA synthesis-associated protein ImuA [Gammaproteobacteria bacterium]